MADKPLDTGDNGFPIDGQKQTFDLGVPDTSAQTNGQPGYGTYKPGVDVSKGFLNDDGTPKDLSKPTKTTLAQYLSKVTQAKEGSSKVTNRYPVDPTVPTLPLTINSSDGYPSPLENPPANANTFAGGAEATMDYPSKYYADTSKGPSFQSQIRKGKTNQVSNPDGHDLLPGIPGTNTYVANPGAATGDAPATAPAPLAGHPDTSKVVNGYTSLILGSNRFTAAAAAFAAVPDTSDPGGGYNPTFTQQGKLGEYVKDAPTVTAGRLATVGPLLTLRATTTLGATSGGADPNGTGEEAAALLPGLAQLGTQRIDQHVLQARDILNNLTNEESTTTISTGSDSWGSLNNTNDPYSGTDALGMLTLSIALVVGLTLITDALGLLLGLITPQGKQPTHDAQGRYGLGQYYANSKSGSSGKGGGGALGAISALASLNLGGLLGIAPTNYPFSKAFQKGFNAFFQLPDSSGLVGQLLGSLTSSTDSPQFNIIVSRTIIRSFLIIKDSLSKIGGNPMNVINAILSMIDTIRSSKIIAALNVWAMLGDAILSLPDDDVDTATVGATRVSEIDQLDDKLTTAAGKSRLKNSLKLAWASNRARTQLLLPGTIAAANINVTNLGQFDPMLGLQQDPQSKTVTKILDSSSGVSRIATADAQAFEALLDAEYVPFYFHDIRTNEMISFHAFLASLTDDYTAAYDKHDAFGRVEPIKIYKGTERRISLSFYVAATSPLDFDEMWVKINKLVTLVYPQYTGGQLLTDGGSNQFIQPFSQLIGAAPLIRIRLGNLLNSNYSKFALARLFGVGNSQVKIGGYSSTDKLDDGKDADIAKEFASRLSSPTKSDTYYVAPGVYPFFIDNSSTSLSVGIGGISTGDGGPKFASLFQPHKAHIHNLFVVTPQKVADSGKTSTGISLSVNIGGGGGSSSAANTTPPPPLICKVNFNSDPKFKATFADVIDAAKAEYSNSDKIARNVTGDAQYVIPASALIPTNDTKKSVINKVKPPSSAGASDLTTFLADSGNAANAIAKSFADTGGKGLAGFIDTLNFDWYDKVTWEVAPDRAAPKFCKVTMTFSPIHDISPGIDNFGFNRAPVYPVGPLAHGYVPPGGK